MKVREIESKLANDVSVREHYLHRRCGASFAFGLYDGDDLEGICIFGTPASRHLQVGCCPEDPNIVIELKRLWVDDRCPRNTESWFVSRCLKQMPPRIVVSYADTSHGHTGIVYRALNFNYAGWTDMHQKNPRCDYVTEGKHSRITFSKGGLGAKAPKVPRKPKAKYWIATGSKADRKRLNNMCCWPKLCWDEHPVPFEHKRIEL